MRFDQITQARKARIQEGLTFLAAWLQEAGIAELSINNTTRHIHWEIPVLSAGVDFAELDAFFGDVENRYHALKASNKV